MPCVLVVTIIFEDMEIVRKAANELNLVEGKDFTINGTLTQLQSASKANLLKQRYGVLKTESQARMKGYKVQRRTQEDGSIQLTLQR